MKHWNKPMIAGLLAAVLTFAGGIYAMPQMIMNVAIDRLSLVGINTMHHANLSSPKNQPVVRPSPDLAYSSCPYDLSAGPVVVEVHPLANRYQSLSIFDAKTDVIFVRNDVQAAGKPYRIALALPEQQVPSGIEVVRTEYSRGIALIRLLLVNPAELPTVADERAKSFCKALGRELINITFEASKWRRAGSKMAAGDSHSTDKVILFSDRSHFGVLRI
jgi:uncharacterized membrane protein